MRALRMGNLQCGINLHKVNSNPRKAVICLVVDEKPLTVIGAVDIRTMDMVGIADHLASH